MAAPLRTSTGSPDDRQTIACLFCGKPQEVARRAMSITCRFCNKSLKLEDISIKQYEARRLIATCGVVTIEKKGSAITDAIKCGGLIVRGKVKGAVESHGPVLIGPEAELKGDVKAPTLAVGAGAVLEGQYKIGWKEGDPVEAGAGAGTPSSPAPEESPPSRESDAPEAGGSSPSSPPSATPNPSAGKPAPGKPLKPIPPPPPRDPAKPSPFKTFPTKK